MHFAQRYGFLLYRVRGRKGHNLWLINLNWDISKRFSNKSAFIKGVNDIMNEIKFHNQHYSCVLPLFTCKYNRHHYWQFLNNASTQRKYFFKKKSAFHCHTIQFAIKKTAHHSTYYSCQSTHTQKKSNSNPLPFVTSSCELHYNLLFIRIIFICLNNNKAHSLHFIFTLYLHKYEFHMHIL